MKLAVIACAALLGALSGCGGAAHNGREAAYYCHQFVKDRLKSPGSAKFSGDIESGSGDVWTVSGSVDSQNSFGALVRNTYTCSLSATSNSWSLDDLDLSSN